MELSIVWTLAQREMREALRNRWLAFYAVAFAALAFALAQAGMAASGYGGLGGFGRTAASLVNAILLFVPLIGLSVGAHAIAADRERGTLAYLLAQPVSRTEVFAGKALGAALAVFAALGLGFGVSGIGMALGGGGDATAYLALAGCTLLLAVVSLGLGFIISALTRKAATALGAALIAWLALVFFGDLALIAATLALRPTPELLMWMLALNPLQLFKLEAVYSLRATLDTFGAAGQYAAYAFGASLPYVLAALLLAWIALAFGAAYMLFNRRSDV